MILHTVLWIIVAMLLVAAIVVMLDAFDQRADEAPPLATDKPKLTEAIAAKLDASPRVVPNWRQGWKWLSTQAGAIAAAEVSAWAALGPDWRAAVPHWIFTSIVLSTIVLGIIGRFVDQAGAGAQTPPNTNKPPTGE